MKKWLLLTILLVSFCLGQEIKIGTCLYNGTNFVQNGIVQSGNYTLRRHLWQGQSSVCRNINSIQLELNEGELSSPSSWDLEREDYTLPNPTKTGFIFLGWTGSNGNEPQKDLIVSKDLSQNMNLVANWDQNIYTINFYGENLSSSSSQFDFYDNQTYENVLPTKTLDDNYRIYGWYSDPELTQQIDITTTLPKQDLTIYPLWVQKSTTESTSCDSEYGCESYIYGYRASYACRLYSTYTTSFAGQYQLSKPSGGVCDYARFPTGKQEVCNPSTNGRVLYYYQPQDMGYYCIYQQAATCHVDYYSGPNLYSEIYDTYDEARNYQPSCDYGLSYLSVQTMEKYIPWEKVS